MLKTKKVKAIFITGPTASGKSDFAIYLAQKINGEVINADSRQVYKYLDIGSGKIEITKMLHNKLLLSRQGKIPHHLLSVASPRKNYSLARWLKDSLKAVRLIIKRKKIPIFCGGTNLYLKALKEGWCLPKVKPNYQLRHNLELKNPSELYRQLKKIDPKRALKIDPHNKRRLIRALEIAYALGKVPPLKKEPQFELLILSPQINREKLFKKIKKRLLKRVPGIIKEVKKLRKIGISFKRIISFGLEYEWFGKYVAGITDLESTINNCYTDIINFAKRQIRELKKIPEVIYVKNKSELLKVFLENKNNLL